MAVHRLVVPGWRPALANELVGKHHMVAHRRKAKDVDNVMRAALVYGVPKAAGKRRVGVEIAGNFGRRPDPDSCWKSLLDALVRNGLLVDDSGRWVELEPPEFRRGPKGTVIVLTDL